MERITPEKLTELGFEHKNAATQSGSEMMVWVKDGIMLRFRGDGLYQINPIKRMQNVSLQIKTEEDILNLKPLKYHYNIIDERYPEDIFASSKNWTSLDTEAKVINFEGFSTAEEAYNKGADEVLYDGDMLTVEVIAVVPFNK